MIKQIQNSREKLHQTWDIKAMHAPLSDLFEVKRRIYWFDLLISSLIGWALFFICLKIEISSFNFWLCLLVAAFAFYRALSFIHELAHLRKNTIPGFHVCWLMLIGIPMMLPTFFYEGIHASHHQKNKYGTLLDGEYLPFAKAPICLIIGNFLSHFVLPIFF